MVKKRTEGKAALFDVIKYSFGGLGSNLAFILVMSYLTYFYTDVFGLAPMVVSALMLVSRFIDAFTDPLMGMIGDHTKSKFGKFRPWIIFGAPLLGFSIYLLFTAPELSPTMKIVYAYITYIFYSLISTVVNIPYHSLTPVMSEDPVQRTIIVSWKQGMGVISMFIILSLGLPLVKAFGGGAHGWACYGALVGVLTTISFWICAYGAKNYDKMEKYPAAQNSKKLNVIEDLKLFGKNKPMLMLMIATGTDVLASACSTAANMYFFKYNLNRPDLIPVVNTYTLVATIVALFFVPPLAKLIGKKRLYFWGNVCCIIPAAIALVCPNTMLRLIIAMITTIAFPVKIVGDLSWGMLPECSDFGEWKFGKRSDGLLSSSLTFINKFGMAIGGFLATFLLGISGYQANTVQNEMTLSMISFMRFGLPILGWLASIISMHFYELTPEKFAVIHQELSERKREQQK